MPFTMLGAHKHKTSPRNNKLGYTFLEYLTLELYDDNGDEYLVWLSLDNTINGIGRKWIERLEYSTNYHANQPFYPNTIADDVEIQIGNRFIIIFQSRFSRFDLTIENDANVGITLIVHNRERPDDKCGTS